ncbi:MAG: hypothetical protein NVSMB30_06780 [Hymenobacter sp.]
MLRQDLIRLFERDLQRLAQEIDAYTDPADIWQVAEGIQNSAGSLCRHVVGNLNAYIGATLGHTGYVRSREAEFGAPPVSRAVLLRALRDTRLVVQETLMVLTTTQLKTPYPVDVLGYPMTTQYCLMHLHGHLTYHLGQVDYHRRLLTKQGALPFVN